MDSPLARRSDRTPSVARWQLGPHDRAWHRSVGSSPAVLVAALACSLVACAKPEPGPGDPGKRSDPLATPGAREAQPAPPSPPWLTEVTGAWGPAFDHQAGPVDRRPAEAIMGSGVALFDCDNDEDLDLFLVQGSPKAPHRLFVRQGGRFEAREGAFEDRRAGFGMGVAVGDFDNDGDEDLYVTHVGPDRRFRNDGRCGFEEIPIGAPGSPEVIVDGWSSSAAVCDLDLDGHLDLYVARDVVLEAGTICRDSTGVVEFCGPESFADAQDIILRNRGDGTFEDASEALGITIRTGSGLGVVCQDLTGDGWPDVYVANDADPNQLWVNRGDGSLADEAVMLGASVNGQGHPEAGMGIAAADLDGDAEIDLFVTHLEDESNTLYRNLGGGRGFEDVSGRAGLAAASMAFTGFGVAALDLDQDGHRDLVVANGKVKRGQTVPNALEAPWHDYAEPNQLFWGGIDGRFETAAWRGGDFSASLEVSRGLAHGDLDGDGDLDLVVTNTQGPVRLYRNDAPQATTGNWLIVEPFDPQVGRIAVGAEVRLRIGERTQIGFAGPGGSYLSSSPPVVHFGLGPNSEWDEIEVRWPGGPREVFPGGAANRRLRLERGAGAAEP